MKYGQITFEKIVVLIISGAHCGKKGSEGE